MIYYLIISLVANPTGAHTSVGVTISPPFVSMAACRKAGETVIRQHKRYGGKDINGDVYVPSIRYSCVADR